MTSEWSPVDPGWLPADEHDLDRLDLLDEFTHPVRGPILRRLREPHSIAEVAELLGAPVTRLYHHVNRLEDDGLVRVVATRRVGAVTERRYQTVAKSFRVGRSLVEHADGAALGRAIGGLFDVAKSALQREFELGTFTGANVEELALQSWLELHLTDERRVELLERLTALVEEYRHDEGGQPFRLFLAAFPETP